MPDQGAEYQLIAGEAVGAPPGRSHQGVEIR